MKNHLPGRIAAALVLVSALVFGAAAPAHALGLPCAGFHHAIGRALIAERDKNEAKAEECWQKALQYAEVLLAEAPENVDYLLGAGRAFKAYIKARQHRDSKGGLKSYRQIATDLGGLRSYVTIRAWMIKDFPRIAEQMRDEGMPLRDGGLKGTNPEASFRVITLSTLHKVRAAFNGVSDPETRGEVIHEVEVMLEEMKRGNFTPYEPDF